MFVLVHLSVLIVCQCIIAAVNKPTYKVTWQPWQVCQYCPLLSVKSKTSH